ncbi:hypothetical protein B0H14DRAFT_3462432 [Mycena olivaceomarginata]|nr:hypothetical protein B0H14DRAFT_3462432 [Mycena olivaceomarginata]
MSVLQCPDTENGSQLDSPDVAGGEMQRTASARAPSLTGLDILPDMEFPINAKAEGRIVMPWQHVAGFGGCRSSSAMVGNCAGGTCLAFVQ